MGLSKCYLIRLSKGHKVLNVSAVGESKMCFCRQVKNMFLGRVTANKLLLFQVERLYNTRDIMRHALVRHLVTPT